MIFLAKGLKVKKDHDLIRLAMIFIQQPRDTVRTISSSIPTLLLIMEVQISGKAAPYCEEQTKVPELTGLYQCQWTSSKISSSSRPYGRVDPVSPAGGCPAHQSGPLEDGVQLVNLVEAYRASTAALASATPSSAAAASSVRVTNPAFTAIAPSSVAAASSAITPSSVGPSFTAIGPSSVAPAFTAITPSSVAPIAPAVSAIVPSSVAPVAPIGTVTTTVIVYHTIGQSQSTPTPSGSSFAAVPSPVQVGDDEVLDCEEPAVGTPVKVDEEELNCEDGEESTVPTPSLYPMPSIVDVPTASTIETTPSSAPSFTPITEGEPTSTPSSDSTTAFQNGKDAQALNAQFDALTAGASCTGGDRPGCVAGEFAHCLAGKWVVTGCAAGGLTKCYALPNLSTEGPATAIACEYPSSAAATFKFAGVEGGPSGGN